MNTISCIPATASAAVSTPSPVPDLAAIKAKQRATWASGDYAVVGTTLTIVGESLCEAVDLRAGEKVLDVAAGNGNATLAAARRFADVLSTDYVPELLERGRERAQAERLPVRFQEADAEALPFEDGAFDVVLSTFGVMFAPDQPRVASELARVTRRGGRIGLACWTPEGFLGDFFRLIGRYVPPPAGVASPMLWGSPTHLAGLFAGNATRIDVARRDFMFRYRSPSHFVDMFRRYYGPTHKAFAALDDERAAALEADFVALLLAHDRGGARGLVVPGEYAEIVVTRA